MMKKTYFSKKESKPYLQQLKIMGDELGATERNTTDDLGTHNAGSTDEQFGITELHEVAAPTLQRVEEELMLVRAAIEKIKFGRFGVCEDCSRRIPKVRLKANPSVERCIQCQHENEKRLRRIFIDGQIGDRINDSD